MFISVFSTRASLTEQINQVSRYVSYDASLGLSSGVQRHTAIREALRIPGVTVAEGWAESSGMIVHLDGSESKALDIVGLPYNARTIEPALKAGRWLEAGDSQSVVINDDLLETEKDLEIGSQIQLKTGDTKAPSRCRDHSTHFPVPGLMPSMILENSRPPNQVDSIRVGFPRSAGFKNHRLAFCRAGTRLR